MIIINSKYEMATNELNKQVTKVNDIIKRKMSYSSSHKSQPRS